ncbi:hypothetical protein Arub01_18530 [Actinomadura rubrobrunea]|uniref:HTH tetR-type domain-containing protein n=1 Tax=Actinomadura rubrobrunea TaxID=115335 RepID=A0A9W6PV26_9ACTN|nr:helix-turn-helix domain-containing protein [Actinomadura rubrobrunea]GLW63609.1 hypothetical protein Arub01_18530 [Actinomadura rubrobrunea]
MPPPTADATRERIIDAAEECFARFGVARTTVGDIATAAGLSRATVYRGVAGGRDELILAVPLRTLRRFLDGLAERLRGLRSVPEAIVEGAVELLFRVIASLIVMDRGRDDAGTRRFPRTYVVPAITGP